MIMLIENEQQLLKMNSSPGFIAALDQSGGSTPGALRAYGIKEGAWSNDEEMFAIACVPGVGERLEVTADGTDINELCHKRHP